MTRRQWFRALAEALKHTRPQLVDGEEVLHQWRMDVIAVAKVCAESNPHFKFNTFYDACGAHELVTPPDLGGS